MDRCLNHVQIKFQKQNMLNEDDMAEYVSVVAISSSSISVSLLFQINDRIIITDRSQMIFASSGNDFQQLLKGVD